MPVQIAQISSCDYFHSKSYRPKGNKYVRGRETNEILLFPVVHQVKLYNLSKPLLREFCLI